MGNGSRYGSKYRNRKTDVDGITFDSAREARRYAELKLLERGGYISNLQLQVPYELIPSQRNIDGKVVAKAVRYIADFVYTDRAGQTVVEDAKGVLTDVYKLKKKLMLYVHNINVKEV